MEYLQALTTVQEAMNELGLSPYSYSLKSTFKEMDVDSLELVQLAQLLEEKTGREVSDYQLDQLETFEDLVKLVETECV